MAKQDDPPRQPQRRSSKDSSTSQISSDSIPSTSTSATTFSDITEDTPEKKFPALTFTPASLLKDGCTSELIEQAEARDDNSTFPSPTFASIVSSTARSGGKKCRFILPDVNVREIGKNIYYTQDGSSEEDADEEEIVDCRSALLPPPVPNSLPSASRPSFTSVSAWKKLGKLRNRSASRDRRKARGRNDIKGMILEFWTTSWQNGTISSWVLLLILGAGMVWVFVENEGDGGDYGSVMPPTDEQGLGGIAGGAPGEGADSDKLIKARHGAVACDVEICSRIGVGLMKAGGNAIDAVIGTGACIGTVNMFASGVGGGGFGVVYMADEGSTSFNFREMAPAKADRDMFNHDPLLAQIGGLAFATPGEVHGYWTMHQKYGRLPWKDLWMPAIHMNRNGFPVTEKLAELIQIRADHFLKNPDDWEFLFSKSKLELLTQGEIMKRPALADTLEIISQGYQGVEEFYNGSIARSLCSYAGKHGGIITPDDFSQFFTITEPTISTTVSLTPDKKQNQRFYTCPPPCSGPVLLEGLNIAEGLSLNNASNPLSLHHVVETMKWISAGRTELGDPADPSAAGNLPRIKQLLTKEYAASVRANISDSQTYNYTHYHPSYEANDPKGTSHISIVDAYGNAVALTTTVNLYWGALLHDPTTGIVLNSEMDDFSIPSKPNAYKLYPSIYNYVKPFKRPLSSTTPTISVDARTGKVQLVIGGSGGSRIVTSVFECVVKYFAWGFGLLDTIRSERIHHQLIPEIVYLEDGVSEELEKELHGKGHKTERLKWVGSVVNGVGVSYGRVVHAGRSGVEGAEGTSKTVWAVADWWRKGGVAAGY